jgi:hypothetical protein
MAGLLVSCASSASITWELNASRRRPAFSSHLLATVDEAYNWFGLSIVVSISLDTRLPHRPFPKRVQSAGQFSIADGIAIGTILHWERERR